MGGGDLFWGCVPSACVCGFREIGAYARDTLGAAGGSAGPAGGCVVFLAGSRCRLLARPPVGNPAGGFRKRIVSPAVGGSGSLCPSGSVAGP